MIKKNLLICLLSLFLSFFSLTYAADTALTELESGINNMLNQDKAKLLTLTDSELSKTINSFNSVLGNVTSSKEYKILVSNNLIELFTKTDIENQASDLKRFIITDYISNSGEYSLLKEKLSLKLIDQNEYSNSLHALNSKLLVSYTNIDSRIKNEFSDVVTYINDYKSKVESLKVSNKELISSIIKKENNLMTLKTLIQDYLSKVDNVNKLYMVKSDDIHVFMNDLKGRVLEASKDNFNLLLQDYINKYPDLAYNKDSIENYINTILDSILVQIDNQFNVLVGDLYSKQDEEYLSNLSGKINTDYYSGSELNYKNLSLTGLILDTDYKDGIQRVVDALSGLDQKMSQLENAYDLKNLQTVLLNKFQSFSENQYSLKYEELKNYMLDQRNLISLQLKQDQENYEKLLASTDGVLNMLGKTPTKLQNLNTLYDNISKTKGKYLKQEIRDSLDILQWKVEYERIGVSIAVDGLLKYRINYPSIDERLEKILKLLSQEANLEGKGETFQNNLIKTIGKVDRYIEEKQLQGKLKYVILEIKRAIIKFIYLNE